MEYIWTHKTIVHSIAFLSFINCLLIIVKTFPESVEEAVLKAE